MMRARKRLASKHATLNFAQAAQQFYAELWLA